MARILSSSLRCGILYTCESIAEAKIDAAALSSNGVEKFRIHLERHQEIRKLQTPSARVPLLRGSKLLFCYLEARGHSRYFGSWLPAFWAQNDVLRL